MKKLELQRRFQEVQDSYSHEVVKEKDVRDFYLKIDDFVQFIESEGDIKRLVEKHHNDSLAKDLEDKLIKLGDEILEELRIHNSKINQLITEKEIVLPTFDEIFPRETKGTVVSLSREASLSWSLDMLNKGLDANKDVHILEIPRITSNFWVIIMDLGLMGISYPPDEKLSSRDKEYSRLLDKRNRRLDYLCIPDFQKIQDVGIALESDELEKGITFKFKKSYKYALRSSNDWISIQSSDIRELKEDREEYYKYTKRIYDLILFLEETRWNFLKKIKKYFVLVDELWDIKLLRNGILIIGAFIWGKYYSEIAGLLDRLFGLFGSYF